MTDPVLIQSINNNKKDMTMMNLNVFAKLLNGNNVKKASVSMNNTVSASVKSSAKNSVKKISAGKISNAVQKGRPQTGNNWLARTTESCSDNKITVYDFNGTPLHLGEKDTKSSGGEGIVYTLPSNENLLVKVYKNETLKDAKKLQDIGKRIMDMVNLKQLSAMDFLAWPIMPVYNSNKEIIGFVMRKCSGNSVLAFRGLENIQKYFPTADRAFLVNVALDYVKKVNILAASNVLINDFNPNNFLVDQSGNVSFIDCDSFQIPSKGNTVNITRTFFPFHSAPELLKNKNLLTAPRNIHLVEFGTAIILFNILMCGQHPYNYYDPQNQSACGSPDENLINGRCPLGIGSGCRFPQGPWYNLWSHLTYGVKNAFIQTFRDGHSDPAKRTNLSQWEQNLNELLYVMQKDPIRKDLNPKTAKPKQDRNSKIGSSSSDF